jgi:hypothetical protein
MVEGGGEGDKGTRGGGDGESTCVRRFPQYEQSGVSVHAERAAQRLRRRYQKGERGERGKRG